MAFCKFSSKYSMETNTLLENIFITEYMPSAPLHCTKVYIYGLMLCSQEASDDNSIEKMAIALQITPTDIENSYLYWQDQGLIRILPGEPFNVVYVTAKANSKSLMKFKPGKYETFNLQLQEIITGRVIYPTEYQEYYLMIENLGFEPDAIILIINHCVKLKNASISSSYLFAVLRDFAHQNIKTSTAVEEYLKEQEKHSTEIINVLKALGIHRDTADQDERNMYLKWVNYYNFSQGVILSIAKKHKNKGGMNKLDEKLTYCFEHKLFSIQEIENFDKNQEKLYMLAKDVAVTLGVYYQNLSNVVDTYIIDWTTKGYEEEIIKEIATYCFKKSIRTYEGMNTIIQKFYKLGLLSKQSIQQYIGTLVETDKNIQQVLDSCGILRNITTWDRDYYRTWTYNWKIPEELIMYASTLAKDKSQPMQYLNKILSNVHLKSITTIEELKKQALNLEQKTEKVQNFDHREYNKQELDSLFDNLDDIEV